jgi:hypothetical protein
MFLVAALISYCIGVGFSTLAHRKPGLTILAAFLNTLTMFFLFGPLLFLLPPAFFLLMLVNLMAHRHTVRYFHAQNARTKPPTKEQRKDWDDAIDKGLM